MKSEPSPLTCMFSPPWSVLMCSGLPNCNSFSNQVSNIFSTIIVGAMKKQQHSTIAIYGTTNDQFPPNQLVISVYMLYEIWMWDGVNSPSYSCSPPGLQRLQLVSHLQWCPSGLRGCSWSILTASMTIWCPGFVNGFPECLLAVTTWPTWSMLMTPSCSAHPTVSWELWAYIQQRSREAWPSHRWWTRPSSLPAW